MAVDASLGSWSLHLLSSVDQALLDRGDALLLFDLFLDLGDLFRGSQSRGGLVVLGCSLGPHLVVAFDIELDLLAGEGSHSGWW